MSASGTCTSARRGGNREGRRQMRRAGDDGSRQIPQGDARWRVRLADDNRLALIGELGHPGLQRHLSEERHPQLRGKTRPASGKEYVGARLAMGTYEIAHVFDDAD